VTHAAPGTCRRCGAQTGHTVQLEVDGQLGAVFAICEQCFEDAQRIIGQDRRKFELLLTNGVRRKRANEIMIAMIDRRARAQWMPGR
jgi:hypothetical protein